ncbi:hypothetical protein Zm00014a_033960 [Zea mays]|uniref:Uncharacterized protein n=1 Tax=Zea mays TaxID=4577 RepID=A0A3L6GBS9_MAIZE|nr:hypothetical protein Zm00014a_033960 [Zea mays]
MPAIEGNKARYTCSCLQSSCAKLNTCFCMSFAQSALLQHAFHSTGHFHWCCTSFMTINENKLGLWKISESKGLQFIIMLHIVSLLATLAHLENIRPITIADHLKTTGRQEMQHHKSYL